jgi:hypothetical protein
MGRGSAWLMGQHGPVQRAAQCAVQYEELCAVGCSAEQPSHATLCRIALWPCPAAHLTSHLHLTLTLQPQPLPGGLRAQQHAQRGGGQIQRPGNVSGEGTLAAP